MNPLLIILDDVAESAANVDTTAVEEILARIREILSVPLFTYGGVTLTLGLLIVGLIKFFVPQNKVVKNQEDTIEALQAENEELKKANAEKEARIQTLEKKMEIVIENTPNIRVKQAKDIKIEPAQIIYIDHNVTKKMKRKVKVKVKKAITEAEAVANG